MRGELDHRRRWLINASGAAMLSSAIPIDASHAQTAATPHITEASKTCSEKTLEIAIPRTILPFATETS